MEQTYKLTINVLLVYLSSEILTIAVLNKIHTYMAAVEARRFSGLDS